MTGSGADPHVATARGRGGAVDWTLHALITWFAGIDPLNRRLEQARAGTVDV